MRLKDAMPKANSRGFLNPVELKTHQEKGVWKTRNGNVSRDMKVPRYSYPRLSDDLGVWDALSTTDLKVRGYLNSRLPDEFSNSDTNLFVRGREKDTKSKTIQPHLFRMVSR